MAISLGDVKSIVSKYSDELVVEPAEDGVLYRIRRIGEEPLLTPDDIVGEYDLDLEYATREQILVDLGRFFKTQSNR